MPPKDKQSKADLAKKQKNVEDKTFGLKNKKKSKSVQKYVQNIQASAQPKPDPSKLAAKVYFFEKMVFFLKKRERSIRFWYFWERINLLLFFFNFFLIFCETVELIVYWKLLHVCIYGFYQKKKDEDKAREKELNDLFKVAVTQPKVPVGKKINSGFLYVGYSPKWR